MEDVREDNIKCAALLFAAIESAHSSVPVNVQDFLEKHMGQRIRTPLNMSGNTE